MACVYWIHLQEHTDMLNEGYIGYTARDASERFVEHRDRSKCRAKKNSRKRTILDRAIQKHKDALVVSTICICDEEYGLWLENRLRPEKKTGWNIAIGGRSPPKGLKHSAETIAKRVLSTKFRFANDPALSKRRSELTKQLWKDPDIAKRLRSGLDKSRAADDFYTKLSILQKEKYADPLYKATMRAFIPDGSISAGMVPWGNGTSDKARWLRAEEYYDRWIINDRCGTKLLAKVYAITNKSYFSSLIKKFRDGWVPSEDEKYQAWKSDLEKENNGT